MSGPAFDKKRQLPSADVAQPYIDAGLITRPDIDAISEGFGRTSRYLSIGAAVGTIISVPLLLRYKSGIIRTALGSTTAGLIGGLTGAAIGAGRMQGDMAAHEGDQKQILRKIQLFQALTMHSNDPVRHPLPAMPNGAQPAFGSRPPAQQNGFLSHQNGAQASGSADQPFRKPFPVPKYDDRPPPEQYVGFARDDARANGDNSNVPDVGFAPDEPQSLGGSRLGSDMDSLESATHENPTSWALLRSRATLNTPSASSLPPPSTSPMSADFSTQSTSMPSIATSSIAPPSIAQPSISLDLTPIDNDARARAEEQRQFDALVDRQRNAGGAAGSGGQFDQRGVKRGETVW